MAVAGVQFKIMPESIEEDLEKIKENAKEVIESFEGGVFNNSQEQPIAFGLKALVLTFAIPESQEIDEVQNKIQEISGISSVEMIDYRRAVG